MATMDIVPYFASIPAVAYVPLLVVTSCLTLHYLVYWRRTAQWRKSNIPFLPPSFLIGHKYFWNMINNSWLDPIDRIYRENKDKDVVGFFMATMPVVLVRNPAHVRQIFVKNFDRGLGASEEDEIAQHMPGMSSDKQLWKSGRKTLTPMFATSRVSGEQFTGIKDQIHDLWTHSEKAHLMGEPLNMTQVSANFLFDAISKSYFNLAANSYEKKGDLLQLVESFTEPSFGKLLNYFARMQLQGVTTVNSSIVSQETIESMKDVIEKQLEQRAQSKSMQNDFINLLMSVKGRKDKKSPNMEIDVTNEIVGLGFSLLLGLMAGGENEFLPSSAIHLLSLHPEYQTRIRKEIEETMKKHNTTEFTYEVVQDLHFLRQCLHETGRLYPTVVTLMRICEEDFKLPGTEHTLKKGERVMIDPYSVHRDPKYFKNPEEFDPDRFGPENKGAPETFLAFGSGPRKCPGKNVAFLLISALIGSLVYKYEVKPRSHLKQMDISDFHPRSFGLRPKDDILVDIAPRDVTAY